MLITGGALYRVFRPGMAKQASGEIVDVDKLASATMCFESTIYSAFTV
jgi:short-subunit dehydrogenase